MTAAPAGPARSGPILRRLLPPDLELAEPRHRLVMVADRRREVLHGGGEPEAGVEVHFRRCPDDERVLPGPLEGGEEVGLVRRA